VSLVRLFPYTVLINALNFRGVSRLIRLLFPQANNYCSWYSNKRCTLYSFSQWNFQDLN